MSLKKIAAAVLVLMAMAGAMTAKAMTLDEMQVAITDLQEQLTALTKYNITDTSQIVKNSSGNYVPATQASGSSAEPNFGNTQPSTQTTASASGSTYQNPASCPPPVIASSESGGSACNNNWGAFYKNSMTGDCCYYKGCEAGENYKILGSVGHGLSLAECQAIPTHCTQKDNSCCKDGKCYEMQNTCKSGYKPLFVGCLNYDNYCEVNITCKPEDKSLVLGDSCSKVCQDRGVYGSYCASHFAKEPFESEFWRNQTDVIGKTKDCTASAFYGEVRYCACSTNAGASASCDALCQAKGYVLWSSCQVNANKSDFVCQLNNRYTYVGTTDTCKPTADYKAGCCCASLSNENSSSMFGMNNDMGQAVNQPNRSVGSNLANGANCTLNTQCASGVCSYTFCVPDSSYCGGMKAPFYHSNGEESKAFMARVVCRNGVWKTLLDSLNCRAFPCDSGVCKMNRCVTGSATNTTNTVNMANVTLKPNGQTCAAGGDCVSGNCSYTYCVPNSSYCGGVKEPMFFANGASASNQWLDGVCRNGVWKTTNNGIGCSSFACDSGTCANNKCIVPSSTGIKANGQQCVSGGECASGNCSYTYCAPAGGCGGVRNPMYFTNGEFASNQWFGGYCRNGQWKVALDNIGCGGDLSFPCDSGSCTNNKCQ